MLGLIIGCIIVFLLLGLIVMMITEALGVHTIQTHGFLKCYKIALRNLAVLLLGVSTFVGVFIAAVDLIINSLNSLIK